MSPHQKSNSIPLWSERSISQLMSHEARTIGLPANFTGNSIAPAQRHLAGALPSIGNIRPRMECAPDVRAVHEGTTCTVRSLPPVGGGGVRNDADNPAANNTIDDRKTLILYFFSFTVVRTVCAPTEPSDESHICPMERFLHSPYIYSRT